MPEPIDSRANALVKRARAVRAGGDDAFIFVEGLRLCEEMARASLDIEAVLYTERLVDNRRGARLLEDLGRAAKRVATVSDAVFSSISDTRTPQGIIALARRPSTDRDSFERSLPAEAPLLVIMHGVNNPSNAGAMLRVAEAAGATGIVATRGATDLFSPKALRGAMGSSFRLPVWEGADFVEAVGWCAPRGILTVGTDVRAVLAHTDVDWTQPRAIVVGSEASGLEPSETEHLESCIRIPMRPPVESLNVAVALAVVLYEAARQRATAL